MNRQQVFQVGHKSGRGLNARLEVVNFLPETETVGHEDLLITNRTSIGFINGDIVIPVAAVGIRTLVDGHSPSGPLVIFTERG